MIRLLDTNACVHCLRRKGNMHVRARVSACPPPALRLPTIVIGELLYGAESSADPAKNRAEVDAFTSQFISLPVDDDISRDYAWLRAHLKARGQLIGYHDLLIAATARVHALTLVTHNTGEFARVPGLRIEDWEIP